MEDEYLDPIVPLHYEEVINPKYKVNLLQSTKELIVQKIGYEINPTNIKILESLLDKAKDDTGLSLLLHAYNSNHYGKRVKLW